MTDGQYCIKLSTNDIKKLYEKKQNKCVYVVNFMFCCALFCMTDNLRNRNKKCKRPPLAHFYRFFATVIKFYLYESVLNPNPFLEIKVSFSNIFSVAAACLEFFFFLSILFLEENYYFLICICLKHKLAAINCDCFDSNRSVVNLWPGKAGVIVGIRREMQISAVSSRPIK